MQPEGLDQHLVISPFYFSQNFGDKHLDFSLKSSRCTFQTFYFLPKRILCKLGLFLLNALVFLCISYSLRREHLQLMADKITKTTVCRGQAPLIWERLYWAWLLSPWATTLYWHNHNDKHKHHYANWFQINIGDDFLYMSVSWIKTYKKFFLRDFILLLLISLLVIQKLLLISLFRKIFFELVKQKNRIVVVNFKSWETNKCL